MIDKFYPNRRYDNIKKLLIQMKERKYFVNSCVICLDPIKNDSMCRILSCYHIFHENCIENWLEAHPSCPVCLKEFKVLKNVLLNFRSDMIHEVIVDHDCFYSDRLTNIDGPFLND